MNLLNTVLFDMGGTLEDIWFNEDTQRAVTEQIMALLAREGMHAQCDATEFWAKVSAGVERYKQWSQANMLEKKPEEIWPEYYLSAFPFPHQDVARISETLAQTWESVYYHRELRPKAPETLEALRKRGYHLGVISNTASLYSVFNVLEKYGIREYFQDVTLSSVTGYRKPHPGIFEISLRQMCARPENCVYVGDTLSRDIIGAKRAGFSKAVQISSLMTAHSDVNVDADAYTPDFVITGEFTELVDYLSA